ncbi:hypothetical protein LJR084_006140 [Variovorax sp. LjRoot84]|uniref:hypothetical protein n=1 Tax=Variovorax sp. LjRoot84 TaxID=3342340 RepID=UPI003ED13F7C
MPTIQGEHVQPATHRLVTYRVTLAHGPVDTVYKAWILLLDGKWHEIGGGTVEGQSASETTPLIVARVLAQIDQTNIDKLNTS